MNEYGSFNWYSSIGDDFFKNLIKAIQHADGSNAEKLKKIFPHICMAHKVESWDIAPKTDYPVTINIPSVLSEKIHIDYGFQGEGTFARYLNNSGHFVTFFSKAILRADKHNRRLMSFQFPQMVAAYHMPSWDKCPPGFTWNSYNAPQKTWENSLSSS